MMTGLSPLGRRLVAIGLLVLAALVGMTAIETFASAPSAALADLEQARARSSRLEALLRRPSPLPTAAIPASYYFQAPTHQAATALVAGRIGAVAASAGLPPPVLRPGPQASAAPNLLRVGIAAEGPEPVLLGFVGDLERGTPPVRLRSWRILRLEGEPARVRLEATAVAAWEGAP